MAKIIVSGEEARAKILSGVSKLTNAVAVTMGPRGRNVIIGKFIGAPTITKDGVSVAREVVLADPLEELGCQLVKEVAGRTADVAGDGTTTATVLAHEIFKNGLKLVAAGYSPLALRDGIDWATKQVVANLRKSAVKVDNISALKDIATISSNNDELMGSKIAEAFDIAGWTGTVAAEAAPGEGISIRYIDGIELKTGYISSAFLEGESGKECILENCRVLICNRDITHISDCLGLFNTLSQDNIPILIMAPDIKQEALATFIRNKTVGRLAVCCVKIPTFPRNPSAWMEDLAGMLSTRVIGEGTGLSMSDISVDDLGFAKKVVVGKWTTAFFNADRDEGYIKRRLALYNEDKDKILGENDRKDIRDRISFLTSKAAVITVGYSTELELREKGDRLDDALFATRAAIAEGVVPGGGTALLVAANNVDTSELDEQYLLAANVLLEACKRPLHQICINAGKNSGVIEEKILSGISKNENYGYNAAIDKFGDMFKMGVIDPKKVTEAALKNASSIATLLITTEVVLAEMPENESGWQPPAGWRLPSDTGMNHKY